MYSISNRNFGLDVIRATAIILVVISHCTYILPQFNSTLTNAIRLLGATGVDIFFVLSGYLIGGILLKNIKSEKSSFKSLFHFWKRRWLRTLPNYFVILTLNIMLAVLLCNSLTDKIWLYIPFLQNVTSEHPYFFTEAWSLSIEEYAYLILPFIIYVLLSVFKHIKVDKLFFFGTLFVILLLFLFKIQFYYTVEIVTYNEWSSQFRKVVIYRLDAIYFGFIMVYLMNRYTFFKAKRHLFFLFSFFSFVLLHIDIVLLDILPQDYKWFYSICYLPLISISIAMAFPYFLQLKSNKTLINCITYISTRSYAIYLVNYSLVLLTIKYFFKPSLSALVLYLCITFILAEVLYRCIEIPFLKLRNRIVPK